MYTVLDTNKRDMQVPVGLEGLRRKIPPTFGARTIDQVAIEVFHDPNLRCNLSTIRGKVAFVPLRMLTFPRNLNNETYEAFHYSARAGRKSNVMVFVVQSRKK